MLNFSLKASHEIFKAMKSLAKSVLPEKIEKSVANISITPNNIQTTLDWCNGHIQSIYQELMKTWKIAGGTILCTRPGRIYLKIKTKAHRSGKLAQLPRNFNLAVLTSPRGSKPAYVQI